jgi:hypothetical protein
MDALARVDIYQQVNRVRQDFHAQHLLPILLLLLVKQFFETHL